MHAYVSIYVVIEFHGEHEKIKMIKSLFFSFFFLYFGDIDMYACILYILLSMERSNGININSMSVTDTSFLLSNKRYISRYDYYVLCTYIESNIYAIKTNDEKDSSLAFQCYLLLVSCIRFMYKARSKLPYIDYTYKILLSHREKW